MEEQNLTGEVGQPAEDGSVEEQAGTDIEEAPATGHPRPTQPDEGPEVAPEDTETGSTSDPERSYD